MNTKALRQKILDLAIHGKLVPQNPKDESATVLLERIRAEKDEKIKQGELKADKKDSFIFVGSDKRHYEQFADGTVKDIEDEIPFDVPEGWAWCRLKEVCELRGGKRIPAGLSATKEKTDHIYIRVTDMHNSSISDTDLVYITDDIFEKIQRYTISKDDLYLTIAGTIGRVGEVPEKFDGMNLTENALKLTNILICKNYLMYILNSNFVQDYFESTYHQVAMPKLSLINASKTVVPIPPLAEQQKIVNKIENVFSIANNLDVDIIDLENSIKQAKSKILGLAIHGKLVPHDPNDEPAEELLKRIATGDNRPYEKVGEEPFEIPHSWKWVKLNDLAEIARGGSPRPIQDYITENDDGINWIKIGDTSEESKYITYAKEKIKPEGKKHSRFVHAGDFLLTNSMSFGRPYILKIDGCIHDGWLVFENIKECLLQDYLYYVLSSAYIYETFSNVAAGSTVKNLKSDTVKQVDFPLPPLSEQKRIVEAVEKMYELLNQIQNNLV